MDYSQVATSLFVEVPGARKNNGSNTKQTTPKVHPHSVQQGKVFVPNNIIPLKDFNNV